MLETILGYIMLAAPYLLLAVGILGAFLLLARLTAKVVAPAVR